MVSLSDTLTRKKFIDLDWIRIYYPVTSMLHPPSVEKHFSSNSWSYLWGACASVRLRPPRPANSLINHCYAYAPNSSLLPKLFMFLTTTIYLHSSAYWSSNYNPNLCTNTTVTIRCKSLVKLSRRKKNKQKGYCLFIDMF